MDAVAMDAAEIDTTEINDGELQPALNLFIATLEQLSIEKELLELKAGQIGLEKPQAMLIQDASSSEVVKDEVTAEQQGVFPKHYNGAVIKDGQVLGVWFDGSRYSMAASSREFRIDTVDQSGRIRISSGDYSFVLNPGDELSHVVRSSVILQPETNADNTSGVAFK